MKQLLFLALILCAMPLCAAPQRVEVSRDVWISSYESERDGNNGAAARLKLKGIQEFFLIDFDPAPLRGKRVLRAQLHLQCVGAETMGRVTVSSVAQEWVEGNGTSYTKVPDASSFNWARTGEQRWSDVDITGSINGQGGSVWGFGDPTPRDANDWQIIPIAPEVVQARLDGRSHGFSVMDDVGNEYTRDGNTFDYKQFPNRFFASRDSNKRSAPYFTLWLEDGAAAPVVTETPARPAVVAAKLPPLPTAQKLASPVAARDEFGEPLSSLDFFAARGEALGFYLETAPESVTIDLEIMRYAMPKVAGHFDPLVPANDGAYIEIFVPKDAKTGRHSGTLRVGGQNVPFAVTVWNFTLPDRLSFIPQMNCYGLPGHERDYYRLAHEHRTTLNCLPYGWTGKVRAAPKVNTDGTWDWREWDARFGPLLDGSAFADLPRGAVPLEALYLPLNENWPMDHEKHFRGGYWIETAYDDDYWQQFRAAAGQFARHFAEKKWTEPMFEFYLNNKVYFKRDRGNRWDACSAPWIFDEPVNTQDFWALRRFGVEFWRGVAAFPGARFAFRADISRPEWQRDLLDGVTSAEIVSGILRTYRNRVIARAEKFDNLVYMYGSANRIGTPNVTPAAWCVETWALGGGGVVPWQTIGTDESWTKPDELSLFYPTPNGPVPSLRLKSFRAGQQLCEYLTMFTALSGQSRVSVGAALLSEPGLNATLQKTSEADAGSSLFGAPTHQSLAALRLRLGAWLDAKAPAPRDRWHDPRPPVRDMGKVREITALPMPQ